VPGLGGGIWSSSQSRGSFKLGEQARRNAAREARMGAPNNASARPANTPSPATSSEHGANSLPFAIPLQPTPKVGRSLSHSQGQREMPASSVAGVQQAVAGMERPAALPLGLLNEEVEDGDDGSDRDSDLGGMLTQTVSHPVFSNLHRTSTLPTQYSSPFSAASNPRRSDTFDVGGFDRRYEVEFGDLTLSELEHSRRPQWHTSLGWEELPNYSESRRHSMADIPARRSSIIGSNNYINLDHHTDNDATMHRVNRNNNNPNMDNAATNVREPFAIPEGYKVPHVALEPHERTMNTGAPNIPFPGGRPRKMLYIVSFKCSRVGVFYLLDNTGLQIAEGDMVIVEADRGQDLGVVQHAGITQEEARTLLAKYGEEQYKWLMMFSQNNQAGAVNPNAAVYGEANGAGNPNQPSTRPPRDAFQNLKPKAIKRMAAPHEIRMLMDKEGNEAKAKRACQQKVYQHHLDMEILEAEFQWDWQKLIFYYYADHYVNFKDLVNDLYKLYKVRLWMSAVNPASFSPNAINQPPTGIGPGAIVHNSQSGPDFDNTYTMAYGTDPDPYGAIPPYQVPYNTYDPNYPAIPGINNSFAPQQQGYGAVDAMAQQFGMMQPYGGQQVMQPLETPPLQRLRMQPIGAGRGMAQQQQQQGGFGGRGNYHNNGYQQAPQGSGVAQHDFGRVTANNTHVDWDALGTLRR